MYHLIELKNLDYRYEKKSLVKKRTKMSISQEQVRLPGMINMEVEANKLVEKEVDIISCMSKKSFLFYAVSILR